MNIIDTKLDQFIMNYSNDMKTVIDKLTNMSINGSICQNIYDENECELKYRKCSSLLVKSNSNPMDSTYHLRNLTNTISANNYKELICKNVDSFKADEKLPYSYQDSESFKFNLNDKLKARRLKQLGVRALSFGFEKEKKLNILTSLNSVTSKEDIEYIDSEIEFDNEDDLYLYSFENDNYNNNINNNTNDKNVQDVSDPMKLTKKISQNSERTSISSPKRSKKYSRPTKYMMKQYVLNTLKQKTNQQQEQIPNNNRKFKSESDLSTHSGVSVLNNFKPIKSKISFYKASNIQYNDDSCNKRKTNLIAAKSDINIKNEDIILKMNNDFKSLLKRKNSENLKSNQTPRIFISKPDDIYNDNISYF
jgi:hypothetical protein